MYTYITVCRDVYMDDWGNDALTLPYVSDDNLKLFDSIKEAFYAAKQAALDELEILESDESENTFNIPEDEAYQAQKEVKVMCYSSDESSYIVTRRIIKEIQ